MMERSPLQYLSKTFTHSSKVTLPNIRKGLVKVTFPSHLQYLNGSLPKSLRSLKVYFRAVMYASRVNHLGGKQLPCLFVLMIKFGVETQFGNNNLRESENQKRSENNMAINNADMQLDSCN